MIHVAVNMGVW